MTTIAIIGGGFTGTMAAVNLARFSNHSIKIVLIHSGSKMGRGIAYGTQRAEHLLNVAARNMSAFPDQPEHFVHWLQTRSEYADVPLEQLRQQFIPRMIYGDYICAISLLVLAAPRPDAQIEVVRVNEEAVDIDDSDAMAIKLASGQTVLADSVILATGNHPPAHLPMNPSLHHDARYCANPWQSWLDRLPSAGGRVVLLGTGLTMVDAVVTLRTLGWTGSIVAISRSGTLPQSHFRGIAYPDYLSEYEGEGDLKSLVRLVTDHCERLHRMSQNPSIAIDKLRPHTQRLWRGLSDDDKRRFLKDYAHRWNVLRHRIAVPIHEQLTDAIDSGQLTLVSGSIEHLDGSDHGIDVRVTSGDGKEHLYQGDLVINCTGPHSRFSHCESRLYQNLLQRGLVVCDPLDMGLLVSDDFAVTTAAGRPHEHLYAIGPMLKGMLWETIAVPELRVQASQLASMIVNRDLVEIRHEDVLEYCI